MPGRSSRVVDQVATRRAAASARVRLAVCAGLGLLVAGPVSAVVSVRYGLLAGLTVVAAAYVVWTWAVLRRFDAAETRRHARQEDTGLAVADVGVFAVVVADFVAVAVLLAAGRSDSKVLDAALAIGSIVTSWFLLHTLYVGRYARLYYADGRAPGGIDFNSDLAPSYREFTYFAFNLGMTYQVSDTAVSDPGIRATVLRHCLMSYFFGTTILACAINLVVGLAS